MRRDVITERSTSFWAGIESIVAGKLETICSAAEQAAAVMEDVTKRLHRAARAMKKAASVGDHAKIKQSSAKIKDLLIEAGRAAEAADDAWSMSDEDITSYLNAGFSHELIKASSAIGVRLSRLDDRLAAFPVIVRILPGQRAIRLNAKRHSSLRPSVIAARIQSEMKKPSGQSKEFAEVLYRVYRLVVAGDMAKGATLQDLFAALTIHPDARRGYEKADFLRDIYLLDASGIQTKSGATISFPAATGTRGNQSFTVIPPDGIPKFYYAVRFKESN